MGPENDGWIIIVEGDSYVKTVGNSTITGNLTVTGSLSAPSLTSTVATGTAPFAVTSQTMSPNLNADMVDGVHATNIVQTTGNWTLGGSLTLSTGNITVTAGTVSLGSTTRQMLNLYSTTYGIGVQSSTVYLRSAGGQFALYHGGVHDNASYAPGAGGAEILRVSTTEFKYEGQDVFHTGNLTGLVKTTGDYTMAGALTINGQSADAGGGPANLVLGPSATVDEGGQLSLQGYGTQDDWHIDNFGGQFRIMNDDNALAAQVVMQALNADTVVWPASTEFVLGSSVGADPSWRFHWNGSAHYMDWIGGTGHHLIFRPNGSETLRMATTISAFDTPLLIGKQGISHTTAGVELGDAGEIVSTTTSAGVWSVKVIHQGSADLQNGIYIIFRRNSDTATAGFIAQGSGDAVYFTQTSDQRLKTELPTPEGFDPVETIKAMKMRWFNWTAEPETRPTLGIFAQEQINVWEEGIVHTDDDEWGVDYGRLTPILIATVQKLTERIEKLEQGKD